MGSNKPLPTYRSLQPREQRGHEMRQLLKHERRLPLLRRCKMRPKNNDDKIEKGCAWLNLARNGVERMLN